MYFIISVILAVCVWFLLRKKVLSHLNFRVNKNVANIVTAFCFVIGIICSVLYLKYDSKGFEYGLGCNFCNKKLPYNLTPITDRYGSFTLNDEEDFELIGTGFGYKKSSFIIKNFLVYGYNGTSVFAKVTDSLNNVKYLISYETAYKSKKGNPQISFKDLSNSDFEKIKDNYQWVELDEEKGNKIRFYRALSFVGAVLSLLLLLWHLIRKRKATN